MTPRLHVPGLLPPQAQAGLTLELPPGPARHAQVLRLQPGSALTLFDSTGGQWQASVAAMGRKDVSITLGAFEPGDPLELPTAVTLAVGMPTEVYEPGCEAVIEFGDRTTVGKGCWFVARLKVVLEEDVTLAPNVYITDHNHTYADPWLPVGQQILQCDPVRVGAAASPESSS